MTCPAFELATFPGFAFSFGIGVLLAGIFVVTSWLSYFGTFIWQWIDEAPVRSISPVTKLLEKILRKRSYDAFDRYVRAAVSILFAPMLIWFVLSFLTFTLICVALFLMAHLTRYVRRLHKTFVKHVADKEAHK